MSLRVFETVTSAPVVTGGTVVFAYPTGTNAGSFAGGRGHRMNARGLQAIFAVPDSVTLSFGASTITATYNGVTSIPANTLVQLHLEIPGVDRYPPASVQTASPVASRVSYAPTYEVDFGAVAAVTATGVCAAQAVAGAVSLVVNGTLAVSGVATFDVPRTVSAVSANAGDTTQSLTLTGTDEFGVVVRETLALNGTTTVNSKKALKTVTAVASSAATAGNISVGTSKILGVPCFVPQTGQYIRELQDGVTPTAGAFTAADTAKASLTTGDVRGTWTPNGTPNAAIAFRLIVSVYDVLDRGNTQFS
jgi:hypothetical protein